MMTMLWHNIRCNIQWHRKTIVFYRTLSTQVKCEKASGEIELLGQKYFTDEWTNVAHNIISKLNRKLHIQPYHPLSYLRQRIINYFYMRFSNRIGSPLFSVYDNLNPVVTANQNFDSLLIPKDHISRSKTDCYYVNQETLLRSHTTAHQAELIAMGLNNFLVIGDVYRRDEIDSVHYPIFHQADGVRLCTLEEVFQDVKDKEGLKLFEQNGMKTSEKQCCHTLESTKIMEHELKTTLVGLAETIFGHGIKYQWNEQYFPFTHPSWELEILYNDKWLEILGCGIVRQEILQKAGAGDRIGWAFGLGLERLAMYLHDIPDIRLFWSTDTGFLNQFKTDDINASIKYKTVSIYPQCIYDISFWLPEDGQYSSNDVYDIARNIAGDIIEQILLKDVYTNPKSKRTSHCYTIVYRHMERTLTKKEVTEIHQRIEAALTNKLHVTIR